MNKPARPGATRATQENRRKGGRTNPDKLPSGFRNLQYLFSMMLKEAQAAEAPNAILGHIATGANVMLLSLAVQGNDQGNRDTAAKSCLDIAKTSVSILAKLCELFPDFFEPMARRMEWWPGKVSVDQEIQDMMQDTISKLNLGKDVGLNYQGRQAHALESKIARQLFESADHIRRSPSAVCKTSSQERMILSLLRTINTGCPKSTPSREDCEAWRVFIGEAARLEPLTRKNYRHWWKAAEPGFVALYGRGYENNDCFTHYWRNKAYKDSPNVRALIRRDIKRNIKQAFRSIAPKSLAV